MVYCNDDRYHTRYDFICFFNHHIPGRFSCGQIRKLSEPEIVLEIRDILTLRFEAGLSFRQITSGSTPQQPLTAPLSVKFRELCFPSQLTIKNNYHVENLFSSCFI